MRTFVLCRLTGPKLLSTRFTVSKKFDLSEYLRDSFSLFKGLEADDYEVVVDFDAWAADEVRGRRWHESQGFTELSKGMLRVSLRLNNVEEVEKWVMGFGAHATVVRPDVLRERLRKTAVEVAERYEEAIGDAWNEIQTGQIGATKPLLCTAFGVRLFRCEIARAAGGAGSEACGAPSTKQEAEPAFPAKVDAGDAEPR